MRLTATVLALLLEFNGVAFAGLDNHPLTGTWSCNFIFRNSVREVTGSLLLLVAEVDGSRVSGSVESPNIGAIPKETFNDGTFDGKVLHIKTRQREVILNYEGEKMSGNLRTSVNIELRVCLK